MAEPVKEPEGEDANMFDAEVLESATGSISTRTDLINREVTFLDSELSRMRNEMEEMEARMEQNKAKVKVPTCTLCCQPHSDTLGDI
ncbi:hypothetical protein KIPB_008802 [Kipferlia bialata]|uniref:Uncharacterized protein n=1 Tax=Kipferlia bialata TaxID=797122 RepID=A0A391NVN0_9EUKA|nr:hypothetical protein KIPB_008802 [Kipferlia bialata]|eukprot:g8802.t1